MFRGQLHLPVGLTVDVNQEQEVGANEKHEVGVALGPRGDKGVPGCGLSPRSLSVLTTGSWGTG